jgi:hypothetical protein
MGVGLPSEKDNYTNPFDTHLALEVEDFEEAKRTLDERG